MKHRTKSNQSITLANLIAIIGIIFLSIFSFIGNMFMSGGELNSSIIWSILTATTFSLLLGGLISIKQKDTDFGLWRIVEYALLFIYVIIALVSSGSVRHYYATQAQKETLKNSAERDINNITSLFEIYETDIDGALTNTKLNLSLLKGASVDKSAGELLERYGVKDIESYTNYAKNSELTDKYINIQRLKLLGEEYKNKKNEYLRKAADWKMQIKSWSILQIPSTANEIHENGNNLVNELERLSKEAKLPTFTRNIYDVCSVEKENQVFSYSLDLHFKNELIEKKENADSSKTLLLLLLIHFIILINYFVAPRSSKVIVGKKDKKSYDNDGGQLL